MSKADEMRRSMAGALRETASHRPAPAAMPTLSIGSALGGERTRGTIRSKTSLDIPVDRVEADPNQPREIFDEEEHRRLTESVRRRGIRMRITVRWSEERSHYLVVAGERRLRAARAAGLETVPCDVIEDDLSESDILILQGIENLIRDDLKPIEQAKLFRTLLAANNWTQKDLQEEFGISQPTISQTLSLLDLPESVQAQVEGGQLAATVAADIASKIDDPDEQQEIAEEVVSGAKTRAEAKAMVRERVASKSKGESGKGRGGKATSKPKAKLPIERTIRTTAGLKIVARARKGFDGATLAKALREALETVEGELAPADEDAA
jgi:ParB family chromosome partitioning protein